MYKNKNGFISIVAISIFFLLTVFGLIVQTIVIDTSQNIRNTNNYYRARDLTDSTLELLQTITKVHDAGFNGEFYCDYREGTLETDSAKPNKVFCADNFDLLVGDRDDAIISMSVNGRNTSTQTNCPSGTLPINECYTVPALGQGTAGDDCHLINQDTLESPDHPCNWNRLAFGSNTSERAVIPLYYDRSTYGEQSAINNSFYQTSPDGSRLFVLRVRIPDCNTTDGDCNLNLQDGNDLVMQWQITGLCGGEECGMVPYVKYDVDGYELPGFSGINENIINNESNAENVVLTNTLMAIDTSTYAQTPIIVKLASMEKPVFILSLNESLINNKEINIPFLEYQLLSTVPVSSNITEMTASINFNGNVFEKTLYQTQQANLIDFAVQN